MFRRCSKNKQILLALQRLWKGVQDSVASAVTDGLVDLKHICGTNYLGMWRRRRKGNKVLLLLLLLNHLDFGLNQLYSGPLLTFEIFMFFLLLVTSGTGSVQFISVSFWTVSMYFVCGKPTSFSPYGTLLVFLTPDFVPKPPNYLCQNSSGAYDEEESAARAYDLAAIKYWGISTFTNFPVRILSNLSFKNSLYGPSLNQSILPTISPDIWLWERNRNNADSNKRRISCFTQKVPTPYPPSSQFIIEHYNVQFHGWTSFWILFHYRKSSGFSRGVSKYRGVARYELSLDHNENS